MGDVANAPLLPLPPPLGVAVSRCSVHNSPVCAVRVGHPL